MYNVLQRFTFPTIDLCSDTDLYFKTSPNVYYQYSSREIHFSPCGEAVFDTYFNSFSVWKWKRHTSIDSLIFRIRLKGRFILQFSSNHLHSATKVVHETIADSQAFAWHDVDLPYDELSTGTLFLKTICLSAEGIIVEGNFSTRSQPRLQPRIGLVITTYNRPEYIRGNLRRLEEAASNEPILPQLLHVVVVDNASNLSLASSAFVTYIQNKNLGGSGGFSRGLIHLREQGGFSHALFMDDDISFDVESIHRAIRFLSYAKDEHLCMSGAMFQDFQPHIQYEAGASFSFDQVFNHLNIFGSDMDMRDWRNIVLNDSFDRPIRYAAWWFFLFPITLSGDDLAFPFFLRGDDILFSYMYAKTIITLNGVCVWHEAFDYKDSATSQYYNQRNFEVIRAIVGPESLGVWPTLGYFLQNTLRENFSYRYVHAKYRIRAMRDFLQGPSYWAQLDAPALNNELRSGDTEKAMPLEIDAFSESYDYYDTSRPTGLFRKALRILTLYGHIVPSILLRRLQEMPMRALPFQGRCMSGIFGQERVLYWYQRTNEGFIATHSKRMFFRNLLDLAGASFAVLLKFNTVRHEYRREYKKLVTPKQWHDYFRD